MPIFGQLVRDRQCGNYEGNKKISHLFRLIMIVQGYKKQHARKYMLAHMLQLSIHGWEFGRGKNMQWNGSKVFTVETYEEKYTEYDSRTTENHTHTRDCFQCTHMHTHTI